MYKYIILLNILLLFACKSKTLNPDATGVFEAKEVIVSAEATGVLKQFNVEEGATLEAGQTIGNIDCAQLSLQKAQVEASGQALLLRKTEAAPQTKIVTEQISLQEKQIAAQREQLRVIQVEQARVQRLVTAQAAPAKQLDDINGQVAVLEKQIAAAQTQIAVLRQQIQSQEETAAIANRGIMSEQKPLQVREAQLDDQLRRCTVINPIKGTVLTKYAEAFEMTAPGKALYKIANIDMLTLRAYITGEQLPLLKIGQTVKVIIAQGQSEPKTYTGTVRWVASEAEFTPKSIQTREERANLVYAVKIETPNDGFLKIGMYADVFF
jgi:HlyD family secretion protein